jgi:hypothetical protein
MLTSTLLFVAAVTIFFVSEALDEAFDQGFRSGHQAAMESVADNQIK